MEEVVVVMEDMMGIGPVVMVVGVVEVDVGLMIMSVMVGVVLEEWIITWVMEVESVKTVM